MLESIDKPTASDKGPWRYLLGRVHGRVVHSRRVQRIANFIAETLPIGAKVLDVGCGDGLIDRLVADLRTDVTISGVDVIARPKTHIPVTVFDGVHLPFSDDSFDAVLFIDVLHHTMAPNEMLKEACRVSRQRIVIKDHLCNDRFSRSLLTFMDFVGNAPHGIAIPANYLSRAEWTQIFEDLRLTTFLEIDELRLYPWWADWLFGGRLHFIGGLEKSIRR